MPNRRNDLSTYRSILFDCDGVLLNSNAIKTEAFRKVGAQFGNAAADSLVEYHVAHGGVSRQVKFAYLLESILQRPADNQSVDELCSQFSDEVVQQLMMCDVSVGLERLRRASDASTWYIVSGGDQAELRQVFKERGLAPLFDGGIFGSPTAKTKLVSNIKSRSSWQGPGLLLGDSQYDWQVATEHGLEFIFVSGWSEFAGWQNFCETHSISVIECLDNL